MDEKLYWKVVSGSMPFEEILAIEDIDQRTQAMRFGDAHQFLKTVNGKRLDFYVKNSSNGEVKYELFEVPKGEVFTQDSFFMVYNCPSTGKIYMSGVEPFKTVADAMAWKQGTTPENWLSMVPLIHES